MQIRTRLTLLFMLITAGILAGVLVAVYVIYQKNTETEFVESLHSKANLAAGTVLRDTFRFQALYPLWPSPEGDSLPYRENVSIYNDAYERVFTMRTESVPVSVKVLQDAFVAGEVYVPHFNLYAYGKQVQGPFNRSYVVVAEGFLDQSAVDQLRNILIICYLVGIMLVALSGWYFSGQALDPVSRMMNEVNELRVSNLSRRVATGNNHDEMARLAETFNRLLDRVEQGFRMQRMFLSNVSHELKNPLTAIRTQLEVTLQRERDPALYQKALRSVLEDVAEMTEVGEKLMQLARMHNNPDDIKMNWVRLDELMWQTIDQIKKRHPEYKVSIAFEQMPEEELENMLSVEANEPLLRTAVSNIMENGCKYSPDHRVQVSVIFEPDHAHRIIISDNGPGIPPEEMPLIFEPFYRSSRHISVKGSGIGLSLVRDILQLHRIQLHMESPESSGLTCTLQFPKTL